ncbi:MAG: bifunctional oligoribonuclease/PAP phosphatase NrnA [Treponema sp.]|nr:bifunctional oligoribonuclease/PAP phosphatase NrnA [Treponema sp.]
MIEKLLAFLDRHDFFILTTHDPADADGLGAEMVLACILRGKGKPFRIINASAIPTRYRFMDPHNIIEQWDYERHESLPEQAGFFLLDTADELNTGKMKDAICRAKEVFIIDHHEPKPHPMYSGITDPSAASACEMVVKIAKTTETIIDPETAFAAYTGIAADTGFFAYPKTGSKTLRSALTLLDLGVNPNDAYRRLYENVPTETLLLQQKALAGMKLHCNNRVAVQILRIEDFVKTGATLDETSGFINFPLKARSIAVSLLLKEADDGVIHCSLRSKGTINVAKIAQEFGGGGHVNASGYTSTLNLEQTHAKALARIAESLEQEP